MRQQRWFPKARGFALTGLWWAMAGCGGDARVELAAADAVDALAAAIETALGEYHAEVEAADDERESAVIAAFVARLKRAAEEAEAATHAAEFEQALRKLRGDRRVEWTRYQAALDSAAGLREIARGLRRVAIESMTLGDEARRYILSLIRSRRTSRAAARK